MRQEGPEKSKRQTLHDNGETSDAVWHRNSTGCTKKQMEIAEMRMLRFSLGVTRKDRIPNEVIRREMKVTELSRKIGEASLRWYGHIQRRNEDNVGNRLRRIKAGKPKRGRPKRRWKDCLKEDMTAAGVTEDDATNKHLWRRKIRVGDPT